MKLFIEKNKNFVKEFESFLNFRIIKDNISLDRKVSKIISDVKINGDKALIKYTKKFDKILIEQSNFLVSQKEIKKSINFVNPKIIKSFKLAIKNIKKFHIKQFPSNYEIKENNLITGSRWHPIDSVGLYVPGGSAAYPSSLLMNVVPAQVAGVKRIVVMTPNTRGKINPYVLALLSILNIKEVYQVGGAQAIAALTYGTNTIKPVNKIFGPGNEYVTSAKKQVFGKVGIDLIAGPSEIVVVADNSNDPSWVASDLMAQAEHDMKAQSILITDSEIFANKVKKSIQNLSKKIKRNSFLNNSLKNYGAIVVLKNIKSSSKIINLISPEHLHLHIKEYKPILNKVKNAGCIFLGDYAPEAFGDYFVGTNHILPTMGSAKFSSGLGVLDFMKRTSYVSMNKKSFERLADKVAEMASIENLESHNLSVKIRQKQKK